MLGAHLDLPTLPRPVHGVGDGRGEGVGEQTVLPAAGVEQREEYHCRGCDN